MHSEYHTYLAQVRAALWGGEVSWPEAETDHLLTLHAQQGTGALVYPLVLTQSALSSYARAQMRIVCVHTMQQQVHLQHILTQSWQALTDAGVEPVLLKGAGLAALYPEPYYRAWGDIDLFVGKKHYHTACAAMRALFPDALKFDEELEHYKHYNLIADGVSIELHRVTVGLQHPLDERRYDAMEKYGMMHSEPLTENGLNIRVPEPTFNVLFVFLHAWEHMLSAGANMRQLCDLALLLSHYKDRIDAVRLHRWLTSIHLLDVWQVVEYILVKHLGLPAECQLYVSTVIADRAERLLADLLGGKMAEQKAAEGSSSAKQTNRFVRKWRTMQLRNENAKRIRQYSPSYARHMMATTWLHGALRFFAKDRHWE